MNQKVKKIDRIVKMDCEKYRESLRRAEHERASVKNFGKIKILLLWKLKYSKWTLLTKPSRDLKPEVKIQ